jgi:hypothetical protein
MARIMRRCRIGVWRINDAYGGTADEVFVLLLPGKSIEEFRKNGEKGLSDKPKRLDAKRVRDWSNWLRSDLSSDGSRHGMDIDQSSTYALHRHHMRRAVRYRRGHSSIPGPDLYNS